MVVLRRQVLVVVMRVVVSARADMCELRPGASASPAPGSALLGALDVILCPGDMARDIAANLHCVQAGRGIDSKRGRAGWALVLGIGRAAVAKVSERHIRP